MTEPNVINNESSSHSTSLSLLERVQLDNESAWHQLVNIYGPMIYGWCLRSGLQPSDASDVGQEVFSAIARSIRNFKHDKKGDTFRGWLFVITQNKLRDFFSSRNLSGIGGSDAQMQLLQIREDEDPSTANNIKESEHQLLLQRAIESIKAEIQPHTWHAFWQSYVIEQPVAEVASELKISINSVYLARSRVLQRLREEFKALLEFNGAQ